MKNKKHLVIGLIIAAAAIYYTFRNISVHEVISAISNIRYGYMVHTLALIALTFVLRAYRWSYLLKSVKNVPVCEIYSPLMIGFMGNLLPARAGEFLRAYLLGKRQNISFSSSFATIVVERLFDILALLLLSSIFIFYDIDSLANVVVAKNFTFADLSRKFGSVCIFTVLSIVIFSLTLVYKKSYVISFFGIFTKRISEKFHAKVEHLIETFSEGLMVLRDLKGFLIVVFSTIAIWIAIVLGYYIFFLMFNINNLPIIAAPMVTVVVCIFIVALPTPGYVGSFQAGCVVALHKLFLVAQPLAFSFGLFVWFVNTLFVAMAGAYYVVKDNISFKQIEEIEEMEEEGINN